MKDIRDNIPQCTEACDGKQGGFKKRNRKYKKSESTTAGEFFSKTAFSVGPHVLDLNLTKDQLPLYVSTEFKNVSYKSKYTKQKTDQA